MIRGATGGAQIGPEVRDTLEEVSHLVREHADALLVAIRQGSIVGSIIGGWDGWRGNIYRLAVAPEARRAGLARRLVDAGERMLRYIKMA